MDLSSYLQDILSNIPTSRLKHYIIIHTLFNTDLFLLFKDGISQFNSTTSIYRYSDDLSDSNFCVKIINALLPVSSLIVIPNKSAFEETIMYIFSRLKAFLVGTVQDIYWMPTDQRDSLVRHIENVTMQFEWSSWMPHSKDIISDVLSITGTYYTGFEQLIKLRNSNYLKGLFSKWVSVPKICRFHIVQQKLGM